jgi:hypothetical protein
MAEDSAMRVGVRQEILGSATTGTRFRSFTTPALDQGFQIGNAATTKTNFVC